MKTLEVACLRPVSHLHIYKSLCSIYGSHGTIYTMFYIKLEDYRALDL